MAIISLYLPVITQSINGLNFSIKGHRGDEGIKNTKPNNMLPKKRLILVLSTHVS